MNDDQVVSYPEKPPSDLDPVKQFTFSTGQIDWALKETRMRIEALEMRLDKLYRKATLKDIQIIPHILELTHDPEVLKTIAKCLDRVADYIPQLDKLKSQTATLEMAEQEPTWFKWAFGNLESEASSGIDDIDTFLDQQLSEGT